MYCKMQTAKLEFRDNNNNYIIYFIHTKYKIYIKIPLHFMLCINIVSNYKRVEALPTQLYFSLFNIQQRLQFILPASLLLHSAKQQSKNYIQVSLTIFSYELCIRMYAHKSIHLWTELYYIII